MRPLIFVSVLVLLTPAALNAAPSFEQVKGDWRSSDAFLLDRHGELLGRLRLDSKVRRLDWVSLKEVSPALRRAVVHAEDRHFETHEGVDWAALGSAAIGNLFGKGRRGASTISMQVAAMLDSGLSRKNGARDLGQKWDQIVAAQELEDSWSKDEILETYLNSVTFRGELQGVDAGSHGLFGKSPSGLDDAESLLLAAMLRGPNASIPSVARRACQIAESVGRAVSCEYIESLASTALDKTRHSDQTESGAPHVAQRLLRVAGEKVRSSLDASLQRFASQSLAHQLEGLKGQNVSDGAVLVVDNESGDVLAYVGNAGGRSSARYVDGVRALRQAGSTLKPFLYATALEKRLVTAASLVDDSPLALPTANGIYVPQNYDKTFNGAMTVRTALASSINIPAVRMLTLVGIDTFFDQLKQLGYSSLNESSDFYGYALALGAADVSLWEQVNAYRTLSNNGVWTDMKLDLATVPAKKARVLSSSAAFIVSDILADRSARSVTFGLESPLATRFWSAVKTGTSKDMRDNWCVGYSQKYTVGVWVGNFKGDAMWDVSGVTGAAPVWLEVMNFLHANERSERPKTPSGLVTANVEFSNGTEGSRKEWFINGTQTTRITSTFSSASVPRIIYPASGTIIVYDPDIPSENQAVVVELSQRAQGQELLLDGVPLSSNEAAIRWVPSEGVHVLKLVQRQLAIDTVEFVVRSWN